MTEIPAYVAKLYNIRLSRQEVEEWPTEGVDDPHSPGKKVYLKVHKFCGAAMVHKLDLIAFLERL